MPTRTPKTRRDFLGSLGAAVALAGCAAGAGARREEPGAAGETAARQSDSATKPVEVGPGEDLMREHGVLRRVMFVYDEAVRRLDAGESLPADVVIAGAGIIRRVIEDYHEKLEEQFIFPRMEKAGTEVRLAGILRVQHAAGRRVTDDVVRLARGPLAAAADRRQLAALLRSFNRMYRPHAAREDTVLFPAFHDLVGEKAYDEYGDQFEDREKSVLGEGGFEKAVGEVARLEDALGLGDLAKFTP